MPSDHKFEDSTLFVLCSDCRAFMDVKDGRGVAGVSHGMCSKCLEEFKRKIEDAEVAV